MSAPAVRVTTPADEASAVDTVVLAFAADPVARWCWRDARQYLAHMPDFTRAFGRRAFANGAAHCTADGSGAALWLPPGVHPDEVAIGDVLERSAPSALLADLHEVFERMAAFHPQEPHWYLPMIGIDPTHQGRGLGSALLTRALAVCDRERMPAYLEATSERSRDLYTRHGFELLAAVQHADSPPMFPMLRPAR